MSRSARSSLMFVKLLLVMAMVFTGCNKPTMTADKSPAELPNGIASDESNSSKSDPANATLVTADVDPDSLNEAGEIVLGGAGQVGVNPQQEGIKATSVATVLESKDQEKAKGSRDSALPVEANIATWDELNQEIAKDWPKPQAVLFVSGQQHGYLEPCGCTGLEKQKGGLIRRDTLITSLRDRGWQVVPVDVGNQVQRVGRQAEIKFAATVEAFKMMEYEGATLGVDDLKLNSVELIQYAGSDPRNPSPFMSANVVIIDESFFNKFRIVEAGGRKIGITGVLGKEHEQELQGDDVLYNDPVESLKPVVEELKKANCDYLVLLAHASMEESASIAQSVDEFDLVVTSGGFGEPHYKPEAIQDSKAVMVQVGVKGMYGGIVGLFDDEKQPIRYQKIAISAQFKDSERMLAKFAEYQSRLKDAGFEGLGLSPFAHPTGRKFVGSETCGECHTTAHEIWLNTPHAHATDSIVEPDNDRGGIARHHDPECVSCHATGWEPQRFYPYISGFINPDKTEHLMGSGCENCHGPGKQHVDAEYGDIEVENDELLAIRKKMVLSYDDAEQRCMQCHDQDNSPEFKFEQYWERVKHYGKD